MFWKYFKIAKISCKEDELISKDMKTIGFSRFVYFFFYFKIDWSKVRRIFCYLFYDFKHKVLKLCVFKYSL